MNYRSEIDGLRALAVLPVLFFHAGFDVMAGGFIGVDVFFVISGYLITTIILTEIESDSFSLIKFYDRRARRILPALIITMLISSLVAPALLLSDPLENFGQSIVSTVFFANNIVLYLTTGYWDLQSEFKPLIHTWSLGIEEQFYLIFPLLLIFTARKLHVPIIIALGVCSLYAAIHLYSDDPSFNFYMIQTRAWELLAGALTAVFLLKRKHKDNEVLAIIGFCLVIGSYLYFDHQTSHPSVFTIFPVFGTVLIITSAGDSSYIGRLLSNRMLVKIGLASYSIYLFHQPIFAFIRAYSIEQPASITYVLGMVMTFVLAYLSLYFIEVPARQKNIFPNRIFYSVLSIAVIGLTSFGLALHTTQGLAGKDFNGEYQLVEKSKFLSQRAFKYRETSFESQMNRNILVIGDSFARDIVNIIIESVPLHGSQLIYSDKHDACKVLNDFENHGLSYESDIIIFGSNYFDTRTCIPALILNIESAGKDVFFVGTKQFGYNLNWVSRVPTNERPLLSNTILPKTLVTEQQLKEAVNSDRHFISILDSLRTDNMIMITDQLGNLISDDRDHLTLSGAKFVGSRILPTSRLGRALTQ